MPEKLKWLVPLRGRVDALQLIGAASDISALPDWSRNLHEGTDMAAHEPDWFLDLTIIGAQSKRNPERCRLGLESFRWAWRFISEIGRISFGRYRQTARYEKCISIGFRVERNSRWFVVIWPI
jgi:hypothetical protein